jgi:diguanylate cyclase (GGDEF)-like protein
MSNENRFQDNLRTSNAMFAEELPMKLQELDDGLRNCRAGAVCPDELRTLNRLLTTLAGSASSVGFVEFSLRAHRIVERLKPLLQDGAEPAQDLVSLAADLDELRQWAEIDSTEGVVARPRRQRRLPIKDVTARLIYLVNDNVLLAEDTALQLKYFGYDIIVISALERLPAAIAQRVPAAIIVDVGAHGASRIEQIGHMGLKKTPTVVFSAHGNFSARLTAVRAGADAYFVKPVDVVALIDRLDALTVQQEVHPYRILIIGDDPLAMEEYNSVLAGAGMDVKLLHDPSQVFRVLNDYRPEILVMDVHAPNFTGADLTRLIRQNDMYLDVPIVSLSNESDFAHQLDAIESGADDFLSKPIEPTHLISSLAHRADRYRALRELIMRDGLTGLYNHSAIKEHLTREISRAARNGGTLSLAILDLDFFKRVNDTYGHSVGDQVIRALARLLQQRLRRSDIIGRYGGEEFVVVLPATSASMAVGVLDQIRDAFSKIRHRGEEGEFTSSFSAGIAELSGNQDAEALFRVADSVLYQAKHKGRNCIETK